MRGGIVFVCRAQHGASSGVGSDVFDESKDILNATIGAKGPYRLGMHLASRELQRTAARIENELLVEVGKRSPNGRNGMQLARGGRCRDTWHLLLTSDDPDLLFWDCPPGS